MPTSTARGSCAGGRRPVKRATTPARPRRRWSVSSTDLVQNAQIKRAIKEFGLEGRRLYLPQMPYGGSYLLAAAIRSIGFDAWPTSDSDERTLEPVSYTHLTLPTIYSV